MTVAELIRRLERMDQSTQVYIHTGNAQSRSPQPIAGRGFKSSWNQMLPETYAGARQVDKEKVVWL